MSGNFHNCVMIQDNNGLAKDSLFILRDVRFLSNQHPPRPNSSMRPPPPPKNSFLIWTPYPPPNNFAGSICQGLQLVEYSSNQTLADISNKEESLFRITCITQENIAINRNTSIGSQMILEFWSIWSLNLSFWGATDPNFLLSESFGHPYGRAGDWLCIRETPG